MAEAKTSPNKYVFLDVVGFTDDRSVESQADIVHALNEIVKESVMAHQIPHERRTFLPTGDGICIVLFNIEALSDFPSPYDVHLRIALDIIKRVHEHSDQTEDELRKFQVSIGINENTDNLVTDINRSLNVAGDGINTAQRLMSLAEGNQILAGESVFARLRYRQRYMKECFRRLPSTKIKHELTITPYQFIEQGHAGLNTEIPERYRVAQKEEPKLTKFAAYYFAHAIQKRKFFLQHKGSSGEWPSQALLFFLAKDSVKESEAREIDTVSYSTYKAGEASLEEQYQYYSSLEASILMAIEDLNVSKYLRDFTNYFEGVMEYRFVDPRGVEKLKNEWPDIWKQFDLDTVTSQQ